MQRYLDLIFSAMALVVLSPLFLAVMIALRLTGEGEVFYVQQRIGRSGKLFGLYKFATMIKDSANIGTGTVTVRNDPRILPFGAFLRATKINELPQLLNILRGEMSLIGPRPQTPRCFDAFLPASQAAIIKVRPGLSGIGSIVFRDEENLLQGRADLRGFYDSEIAPYKGMLEEWYVQNQGVVTYILLVLVTAWVVVFPASQVVWRLFRSLPPPPPALLGVLRK